MPDGEDRRARRGARACLPPLSLVAVAFFLPMVRGCGGDRPMSPLSVGLDDGGMMALVWPLFLIAAALALLTLVQPAAGPSPRATRAVLAAPILTWIAGAFPTAMAVRGVAKNFVLDEDLIVPAFASLLALPLSIVAFRRALRSAGWIRWRNALASFAAAAYLTYPAQFVFDAFADMHEHGLLAGAYVLALSLSGLAAAAAWRG